jgi:hypothetical protein
MQRIVTRRISAVLGTLFGVLLLATAQVRAQSAEPFVVTLRAMGTTEHVVAPGQALAERLAFRALDATGRPMPGIRVGFQVNQVVGAAYVGAPPLPPDSWYGHFANGAKAVIVVSDADGIAIAPDFFAGVAEFDYTVFGWIPPQTIDGRPTAWSTMIGFTIMQRIGGGTPHGGGGGTTELPAGSPLALGILAMLLVIAARRVRRGIR